jgi:D-alanyl-D-alanine dipeptidase
MTTEEVRTDDDGTRRMIGKCCFALLSLLALAGPAVARDVLLPNGLVYLRDIDAGIAQDMRYAGADNFVGRPLPGYDAAECVLRREAAAALARVQADLAKSNLGLKVYDCYRPRRASAAMVRWAQDGKTDGASVAPTKRFYPALEKRTLFALGYIAAQSAHATGRAVDLTLVRLPAALVAPFDSNARYGACTGPAAQRAPDSGLDMGTGFDCFDAKSHTASSAIAPEQRQARATLVTAMRKQGFRNYFREWWHFTYALPAARSYDVPIAAR